MRGIEQMTHVEAKESGEIATRSEDTQGLTRLGHCINVAAPRVLTTTSPRIDIDICVAPQSCVFSALWSGLVGR